MNLFIEAEPLYYTEQPLPEERWDVNFSISMEYENFMFVVPEEVEQYGKNLGNE